MKILRIALLMAVIITGIGMYKSDSIKQVIIFATLTLFNYITFTTIKE